MEHTKFRMSLSGQARRVVSLIARRGTFGVLASVRGGLSQWAVAGMACACVATGASAQVGIGAGMMEPASASLFRADAVLEACGGGRAVVLFQGPTAIALEKSRAVSKAVAAVVPAYPRNPLPVPSPGTALLFFAGCALVLRFHRGPS